MANTRISALTSASTPLTGTEVLPIVQSGATVKVANNDLRPKQIQSNATSGVLQVAGPGAASTRVMTTPDANFTVARTDAAQTFTGNQTFDTSMALSAVDPDFTYTRFKTSVSGSPFFTMQRSRGASAGVNTIVQAGDWLGGTIWQGANGTGYSDAAYLYAVVNGTPGASNDMPGAIRMATSSDGSASPTTRLDIGADGNVTVSTGNLVIGTSGKGIDFSSGNGVISVGNASYNIYIGGGTYTPAEIYLQSTYAYIQAAYNNTTASAANVFVASTGELKRSTSALKYKQDVRDVEDFNINGLRPVRYKSKCEGDDQTKDHFGLIADEAAEAGFEELVTRSETGEIEGFQYERLTVVLLKKIQVLESRLAALEAK